MDIFLEHIVKHKKTLQNYAVIGSCVLGGIIMTVIFQLFSRNLLGLGFIFIAGAWYGMYLLIQTQNIEYEYILTNSELDIDKIIAKRGRKHIITINFKEIEVCANVKNPQFENIYKNNSADTTLDLSGDINGDNVYFVDMRSNSERKRVFFQPNEKIIKAIQNLNLRNIHI